LSRGRTFEWRAPDGQALTLAKDQGYWVLSGVKGLGMPLYVSDLEDNAAADGVTARGARASGRQVFLPMLMSGDDRTELLSRMQLLGRILNPKNGPGQLYVTDDGNTYRLKCLYGEGLEGDESDDAYNEVTGDYTQKTGLTLNAVDPYFESTTLYTQEYGFAGNIPFFQSPFFPLKLNSAQVLSDVSQPARNNFVLNPSAETNASNWTNSALGSTPSTISRSAIFAGGAAPSGDWVFDISASAAGSGILAFPDLGSAGNPFTIGQTYTFHGWAYVPSGMANIQPEIFFGAVGSVITIKDTWVWWKVTWTAAGTGDRPCIQQNSAALGDKYYLDKVDVTEGIINTPQEYIDGDQPDCHWSGTAHGSTSSQDPIFEPAIITNPGTVESYPVLQVIGPGDSLIAKNLRSGRTLSAMLSTALGSGQVMTLDFARKTARLDDGTNLYNALTEDDFWPLLDGDNPVQLALSGAATGSKIIVTWYPRLESLVA
jgi:Phage tail protein